jgi:hypothetical protein
LSSLRFNQYKKGSSKKDSILEKDDSGIHHVQHPSSKISIKLKVVLALIVIGIIFLLVDSLNESKNKLKK